MKEDIVVVGLGSGGPDQLTLGAWTEIKDTGRLLLATSLHPVVQWLDKQGVTFKTLDRGAESDGTPAFMARSVVKEALTGPVVFAVPGHPVRGDKTVTAVLERARERCLSTRVLYGDSGAGYPLDPLVEVMARLRGKEGCPWDKEQDHFTLTPYLLEETYEVLEALEQQDMYKFCEELGDLLLQIVFHAQIAGENGQFNVNDVVASITEKMIRRHPHVFGDISVENSSQVLENWEKIKQGEKDGGERVQSILEDIPRGLPALLRASKVQNKASRVGFDWPDYRGPVKKIKEELQELMEAYHGGNISEVREETGDLLFAVVNLSRFFNVDAEAALNGTVSKFIRRFRYVEEKVKEQGKELQDFSLDELDHFWDNAKKAENWGNF